jgi:hypothetical protein
MCSLRTRSTGLSSEKQGADVLTDERSFTECVCRNTIVNIELSWKDSENYRMK